MNCHNSKVARDSTPVPYHYIYPTIGTYTVQRKLGQAYGAGSHYLHKAFVCIPTIYNS